MKKILYLLFAFTILNSQLSIVNAGVKNATTLCIEDKTGGVLKFYLSERPKITFRGNYTIVQAGETKLLQFRNLAKAYFTDEDDPTGISEADASVNTQYSIVNSQ